jgi:hypothetical protein
MTRAAYRRRLATVLFAAVVAAIMALFAATAWAPPAEAHDHRIPETVLKKGARDLQGGLLVAESFWSRSAGGGRCEGAFTDYVFRFPKAGRVAASSALRVRIFKEQRPDSFTVKAHRKVEEDGLPIGQPQRLPRTLYPVVRGGERVAWDARFRVGRPSRDYYLVTEGHWGDREGCDVDQYAYWGFHVKTGR